VGRGEVCLKSSNPACELARFCQEGIREHIVARIHRHPLRACKSLSPLGQIPLDASRPFL
jgi:hypothetical protein